MKFLGLLTALIVSGNVIAANCSSSQLQFCDYECNRKTNGSHCHTCTPNGTTFGISCEDNDGKVIQLGSVRNFQQVGGSTTLPTVKK